MTPHGNTRIDSRPPIAAIAGLLPAAEAYASAATGDERLRAATEARKALSPRCARDVPEHVREAALAVALDSRPNEPLAREAAARANAMACSEALQAIAAMWPPASHIAQALVWPPATEGAKARAYEARRDAARNATDRMDGGDPEACANERTAWRKTLACTGANNGAGALASARKANQLACARARRIALAVLKVDPCASIKSADESNTNITLLLWRALDEAKKTGNATRQLALDALAHVAVEAGGSALRAARAANAQRHSAHCTGRPTRVETREGRPREALGPARQGAGDINVTFTGKRQR